MHAFMHGEVGYHAWGHGGPARVHACKVVGKLKENDIVWKRSQGLRVNVERTEIWTEAPRAPAWQLLGISIRRERAPPAALPPPVSAGARLPLRPGIRLPRRLSQTPLTCAAPGPCPCKPDMCLNIRF